MSEHIAIFTLLALVIIAMLNFFSTWHLKIISTNSYANSYSEMRQIKQAVEQDIRPNEQKPIRQNVQDTPSFPVQYSEEKLTQKLKEIFKGDHE